MRDTDKSKEQLIAENEELRQRLAERAQTEVELRESDWRWRHLVEGIPLPIWQSGANDELIECNRRWGEYTGQTTDEAKGHGWMKVIHPDDLPRILEEIREGMAGGEKYQLEYRIRRACDGTYRWHLARGVPLKREDGTLVGWFGYTADIEDQRHAEKELAKSRAMLQSAIECFPFDFFALGSDGHFVLDNAVSRAKFGRLIGKTPEEIAPTEAIRALWLDANRRASAGETVEDVVALTLNGEERFVYNVVTPIRDETHSYGILGINVDITERRRAEEALQKAHDELEQRVEARSAELRQANEELAIFRRFAEATGQGFGMADLDGKILYMNPALCRMLAEERPETALGKHFSIYYSEESNRRWEEEIRPAVSQEGHWEGEFPMLSRQGRSVPTWHNSFLIRDDSGRPLRLAVVTTEITERKAAEDALRASEERFRVTFEEAPVGMVICAGDGVITRANRALCRMSGYSQEELIGRHAREFAHPQDRELSGPYFQRLLAGEIPSFALEQRYLRKDGRFFWAQATAVVAHGSDNKIVFALGVLEDVTERKRAEESLRQSERRFRNYFEQGLIGMAVTSLDKHWLEANDRLCEILGYSREELRQKTWVDLTHPDDIPSNLRLFNSLLTGEIEHFTRNKRYLAKDGSIVHATLQSRAFGNDDGTIDHIVTLVEDITARKLAEEALRNREYQLRNVLDTNPSIIFVKDRDSKILLGNAALARFYGIPLQQIVGTLHTDVHARLGMSPQEIARWLADDQAALDTGITQLFDERATWKDGSVHWYHTTKLPIALPDGQPGVLVVSEDITECKQAQEALEKERRTLEHMLQASDHERQLIAYDIHDGLAQELAGALMQFQIHAHARQANPEDAARAFEAGIAMLQQSHIEARRLISGVRPPILDESGVVAAIVHMVYDPAFEQGPTIDFRNRVKFQRLAPILENVIYRIVQESLTNARNHSQSKKIRVSLKQRGERLRIKIRDWGVGFDAEAVQEGHFGLEGIRERARLLGGECSIKSKPGRGTLIAVELPVVEGETEP